MRMTVACAGHAAPHAGWAAIDELADLLVHYFDATLLSPRRVERRWPWPRSGRSAWQRLDSDGGDVLFVVAHAPQDLAMIDAIPDARRRFGRIVAWVTDSYFEGGFGPATAQYDGITVTAPEDQAHPRQRFGIPVHQVYQGVDGLAWAPRQSTPRAIDLIGFGRMPASYHAHFARRFHGAQSPALYLHSPLGHVTGPDVHLERGMLFKLLHRASVSLAFHLFVEPEGQRPRSMMVTSRWLESLVSGCVVAGRRPVSTMADEMLAWPGATLELGDDPRDAGDQLLALLAQGDALEAQRHLNVQQTLLRHDWRHRIVQMCACFGLPVPPALAGDIAGLQDLAACWGRGAAPLDAGVSSARGGRGEPPGSGPTRSPTPALHAA
ncbi:MAG: glycosyltransferase family 1 protein [Burkholderiaceae bacterium]|nr:glycosyltransferase family 1 protein [Rhodoferax sp.]MCP5284753.1 glycosyltransferase family 1 protein [Burkholderiaceae bacterium]